MQDLFKQVNWVRFILAIIAVYAAYSVLYIGSFSLLDNMNTVMQSYQRPETDPLMMWGPLGHLFETIIIVAIYFLFVKTNNRMVGLLYGALFGLYYAATQISTMGGFATYPADLVWSFLPLHIIAGAIAGGWVLALVYKGKAESSSE